MPDVETFPVGVLGETLMVDVAGPATVEAIKGLVLPPAFPTEPVGCKSPELPWIPAELPPFTILVAEEPALPWPATEVPTLPTPVADELALPWPPTELPPLTTPVAELPLP